jgi:hypothetical protein
MTMPEGAQVSPDGQWWWDEGAQAWQPMAGGAAGAHGDAGTHEQPQPEFIFDTNGLWVGPDDTDNPDNHAVLHHDAGTQVSFLVWNIGPGAGAATVTISVDDTEVQTWVSGDVAPNQSAGIDGDGFVHGCGRHPAGQHVFRARATPGHPGGGDDTTNDVDIE